MKTILKVLGGVVALVVLGGGGFFAWAKGEVSDKLARTPEVHSIGFAVPYPLPDSELAALRTKKRAEAIEVAAATAAPATPTADAGVGDPEADAQEVEAAAGDGEATVEVDEGAAAADDAAPAPAQPPAQPEADPLDGVDVAAIANQRALARGKHLVTARYACIECHGKDFSGGVMVDDPAMGTLLGPNLTLGEGGVTAQYTPADWDRIVRHGIKKDGHPGMMPSEDFQLMSDQELSDIIVYLRAQPPVDNLVARPRLGPLGTILAATGKLPIAYDKIHDHGAAHAKRPPPAVANAEFGKHLAGICTGCHREGLEGGPIAAGPPDWAPARNLTPHEQGTAGWTFEQFDTAMREGLRPDGSELLLPMALMKPYAQNMTDTEMRALWAYISGLPPTPTGQ